MATSCTSSSSRVTPGWRSRWPWAGLLALLLLIVFDGSVYRGPAVWTFLSERDPFGTGTPRLELVELRDAPADRPLAIAVGPSRVFDGFSREFAQERQPDISWGKLAHPRFDPFVVRAMQGDITALDPDVVVFVWSEIDTNRPLRLEPIPGSSISGLGAVADLLLHTGLGFAIENHTSLYRLVATSWLRSYRYRAAFGEAGLDEQVNFTLTARHRPALPRIFGEPLLWDAQANPVPERLRREIVDTFRATSDPRFADLSVDFVSEITPGPHADLQRFLIRRTMQRLRDTGIEVVLIEGAMHPLAARLYDTTLRHDFVAFGEALARDLGVRFVPLEDQPKFGPGDFKDLFHARGSGTLKLTDIIMRAVLALPVLRNPG